MRLLPAWRNPRPAPVVKQWSSLHLSFRSWYCFSSWQSTLGASSLDSVHITHKSDCLTMNAQTLLQRPTRRGQALVETALVLPILIMILLLGIDLGRVFFTSIDLRNAAHEATMLGGTTPDATCAEIKAFVDRQMGRTGANGAACGAQTATTDKVYITSFACERADAGTPCSPWAPTYPADADLRYAVRLELRFQPVFPLVGFLTGNGMGGSIPLGVENRSPVLVGYEGS